MLKPLSNQENETINCLAIEVSIELFSILKVGFDAKLSFLLRNMLRNVLRNRLL